MDNRMSLLTSPFVPEGMVDLMKKLSKGVIKERPADIYTYAADFFEKMLIERDGSLDKGYGKFRSYTEYCKFMDKMDQRRLNQSNTKVNETTDVIDAPQDVAVPPMNIEVQGVAIQGVERKSKDIVKNVSINPKYQSHSEKVSKPVTPNAKNVKTKPRKLSSKKPSENLIVIKEETSADVDDNGNGESKLNKAAVTIQKAFRIYLSQKKMSQDEHLAETSGNVSHLSEDAAALIIQKAFKSLIQKLKPLPLNSEKIDEESNNNIVKRAADGQENEINIAKIINNTDENSEQIIIDDEQTDTKQELERDDKQQGNASEDTASATREIEMNETQSTTNLEAVTASHTTETQQQIEGDENQNLEEFNSIDSKSDECKQVVTSSNSNNDISDHQILPSSQENEALVTLDRTASPPEISTETNEIDEMKENIQAEITLDEFKKNDIAEHGTNDTVDNKVQSGETETQVESISDNSPAELLTTETANDNSSKNQVVSNNATETELDVDHSTIRINTVDEVVKREEVPNASQLEQNDSEETKLDTTLIEPSENVSTASAAQLDTTITLNDNVKRDLPSNENKPINDEEENVVVESSPAKKQLFVVDKDAIYVNMDLLQEKLGTAVTDDGLGSDSEKSFKLNILEREDILVNQENVQQIRDELVTNDEINDKIDEPSNIVGEVNSNERIDDDTESTENNYDVKDEDGNEEYELAETVVLVDVPLKSKSFTENEPSVLTHENVYLDTMKSNKFNDELPEPYAVEKFSGCVSPLDDRDNDNVVVDSIIIPKDEGVNEEVDRSHKHEVVDGLSSVQIPKDKVVNEEVDQPHEHEVLKDVLSSVEIPKGKVVNEEVDQPLEHEVVDVLSSPSVEIPKDEVVNEEIDQPHEHEVVDVLLSVQIPKDKVVNEEVDQPNQNEVVDVLSLVEIPKQEVVNEEVDQPHEHEVVDVLSSVEISKDEVVNEEVDQPHEHEVVEVLLSVQIPKDKVVNEEVDQPNQNEVDQPNQNEVVGNVEEETTNENVENQMERKEVTIVVETDKVENEHVESLLEDNGIDEVDLKHKLPDEKLNLNEEAFLEDKIDNSDATTEPVTCTENQPEDKLECETKENQKTNGEVVQDEAQNKFYESMSSKETNDNISLPNTEEGIIKTENKEEISAQLSNMENVELVKAATTIQKVFRGYIVRSSVKNQTNIKKDQLELSAALVIQKYVRGYLVRRNVEKTIKLGVVQVTSSEIKDSNGTEENANNEVVPPPLPAYSNRFLIPKDSFLERESFADDEDYARTCKELAATSIQKTYRGYRVRRSLKASTELDIGNDDVQNKTDNGIESFDNNHDVQTVVTEAERVISAVLDVATDVLPLETYDSDSFEDEATDNKIVVEGNSAQDQSSSNEQPFVEHESVLGQIVQDNIHVEGQMQQKYNQITFQGSSINPIEEMSDSSEPPETPRVKPAKNAVNSIATLESESVDSKHGDGFKSFSYEQLSSDLSDTDENKRESQKESEVDETSRDELSEVENFDLSSCGEDSLEAMYYSIRKSEIMLDKMHKQVAEQREPRSNENGCGASENAKVEFPERVTENLDVAMEQVFKSMESSSDCDAGGKKDEDDNSSTLGLDLGLDDSSSINDEKEIETSRQIIRSEETNLENEEFEFNSDNHAKYDEDVRQSPQFNVDAEASNTDQSQQSDSSFNSSTRFIMKSQSVSEDMMNPIMFAMKRKQALLDQMHVRPYPLQENLSEEDHDAFPEHLLTDIDIGNIQRKIFASSISETDSDYIESNATSRRLVRDDFNISTALDHLSTDSDSTIVSAATKIQAGARGFLTRRRLRRSSAGGTTSISFEKRYSFGNAAIDKSLEDLIKRQEQINLDGAALKIQQQYRRYQARKNNLKKVSPIREQQTLELSGGSSIDGMDDNNIGITEITLAQKKVEDVQQNEETTETHPISLNIDTVDTVEPVKRTPVNQRRLTLQRGDAVQQNSRPDSQELNVKDGSHTNSDNQSNGKLKDSETGEYTGTTINSKQEKKVTAYINIQSLINRGIGPRQRSMPVQIDSELMRIIPKHLRKRVKSADIAKKKNH